MSRLDDRLQTLRHEGRAAFIPFLTAGDPSLEWTGRLIDTVIDRGADIIEIGFPYSDPLADGAVIQASYARALKAGLRLDALFQAMRSWTQRHPKHPMVGMASYSLVYRQGPETFFQRAQEAGLSGLILPDLPLEEAEPLVDLARQHDLALILLVTPTTLPERAEQIARQATGFLYVVSVTGITGARAQLAEHLLEQLAELRKLTTLPLCVGFGISQPEHVQDLKDHVDGVIVGSALVQHLERIPDLGPDAVIERIGQHAQSLAIALRPRPSG